MKKLVMFAVIGVLLSTTAFARVIVLQDGRATNYKPGEQIVIDGKTSASILSNGVLIKVPENNKNVKIEEKDGKIYVSGTNLRNIKIDNQEISSDGKAELAISPETKEIVTLKGDTTIVRSDALTNKTTVQKASVKPVKKVSQDKVSVKQVSETTIVKTVEFPEVSDYVNEVTAQQAAQDVEDMSQSSPRS